MTDDEEEYPHLGLEPVRRIVHGFSASVREGELELTARSPGREEWAVGLRVGDSVSVSAELVEVAGGSRDVAVVSLRDAHAVVADTDEGTRPPTGRVVSARVTALTTDGLTLHLPDGRRTVDGAW